MTTLSELIVFWTAFVLVLGFVIVTCLKQRVIFAKKPRYYFGFLIWGIASVVYFLAVRWIPDLIGLVNYLRGEMVNEYTRSIGWSKVLLLDMCPFLSIFMPVYYGFFPRCKLNKLLASISIFTGSITLYAIKYSPIANFDFQYLFFGIIPNRLYFLMHFNIVVFGMAILLVHYEPFVKIDFIHVMYVGAIYLLYAYVLKLIFSVEYNVTGLVVNDWIINNQSGVMGEYYLAGKIINLTFPNVYGVVIVAFLACCWLVMLLHNCRYQLLVHYYCFWTKKKVVPNSAYFQTPIDHLVSLPDKPQLHYAGRLDFVTFWKAHWQMAWVSHSWWMRGYCLICGVFIFYFPAIVVQYGLQKIYCWLVDYEQIKSSKQPPVAPKLPPIHSKAHEV